MCSAGGEGEDVGAEEVVVVAAAEVADLEEVAAARGLGVARVRGLVVECLPVARGQAGACLPEVRGLTWEVHPRTADLRVQQRDLRIPSLAAAPDLILEVEAAAAVEISVARIVRGCSQEPDPISAPSPARVRSDRGHRNCRARVPERALARDKGSVLAPVRLRIALPNCPATGQARGQGIVRARARVRESAIARARDKELRIALLSYRALVKRDLVRDCPIKERESRIAWRIVLR